MGERDHSIECEACGYMRGGINDAPCNCDIDDQCQSFSLMGLQYRLGMLSHNLTIAGALCRAFQLGGVYHVERYIADWNGGGWTYPFSPGCGRSAP